MCQKGFCMKKRFFYLVKLLSIMLFFSVLVMIFACGGGGGGTGNGGAEILLGAAAYVEPGMTDPDVLDIENHNAKGNIFYVIADSNKSTWDDDNFTIPERLKTNLRTAIEEAGTQAASTGVKKYVFVQEGTYIFMETRWDYFSMKNNVIIIGGFLGTEMDGKPRGKNKNTIISAEVNGSEHNAYHVFYNTNLDNTAELRNVTIMGGNANGDEVNLYGGGMVNGSNSNPTITGCYFVGNYAIQGGGGIYNFYSSPIFTNCTFQNNTSSRGGGICTTGDSRPTFNSKPTFNSCYFIGNTSSEGGGIYITGDSKPTFNSCYFIGNTAHSQGGGIYIDSGNITWEGPASTVSGNVAGDAETNNIFPAGTPINNTTP